MDFCLTLSGRFSSFITTATKNQQITNTDDREAYSFENTMIYRKKNRFSFALEFRRHPGLVRRESCVEAWRPEGVGAAIVIAVLADGPGPARGDRCARARDRL